MPLVRITINVPNVDDVMEDYSKIKVYRAETKWGSYTEISNSGTRVCLESGQYYYDFDDNNGSEYYWYKWCYFDDTGATSPYFAPVQGYTPGTTYCGFDVVKRTLMAADHGKRIQFSDEYRNLRPGTNNDAGSTIDLAAVSMGPSYAGHERFTITFTSATEFTVTVTEEETIAPRILGTGDTSTDFTAIDNSVRINSDDWSGTAVANDTVEFESVSHMSVNDAVRFIQDAEIFVDMILEQNISYLTPKDLELRFTQNTTPKAVGLATAKFAAFFIYSTIYNEQSISGLPPGINDIGIGDRRREDLSSWAKQGMRLLEGFIDKYTKYFDPESGEPATTGPRWQAMDTLFDAVGVAYVGDGLKLPDVDQFKEKSNMDYANLQDWDLLVPGVQYYSAGDVSTLITQT